MKVETKNLWTQSEYAREIGESPQTVKYWVKTEKVKSVKINGAILVVQKPE